MSEHHDEAMHEDIPVMGDLDSDSNGVLTWEEYSSRLRNHVKQMIEEGKVEQRVRVGKDGHLLSKSALGKGGRDGVVGEREGRREENVECVGGTNIGRE